jgi:hypothetical protein
VLWGLNTDNYFDTRIVKHPGNVFSVINKQINGLYFFDSEGNFIDRKLLKNYRLNYHTTTSDNNILVLETNFNNGFSVEISKQSNTGAPLWLTGIDGRQQVGQTGYSCCSNLEEITAIPISIGGN